MPDGSEPSQAARQAATTDPDVKPHQASVPDSRRDRGFRLRGLFRKRNGHALEGTVNDANGRERDLSPSEKEMIEKVVALENVRVGDVAIPRADIIGVEIGSDLNELLACFAEAGHSRLPVYRGDLDDPVGFIHIKDVVTIIAADRTAETVPDQKKIIRKLLYAPPSMPVADLLLRMQAQRIHMALVIDEFGGTDGLVTIEDIIEEIVGDIRDEHDDTDDVRLRQTSGGRWDSDARAELSDLAERLGVDLRLEDDEADTLGGLVFGLAGRVPLRGEVISHPAGHEFEVAEADGRRVRRVLIRLAGAPPSEA